MGSLVEAVPLDFILGFPIGVVSSQQVSAVAYLDLGDRFERLRRLPPRRLIVRLGAFIPDQGGWAAVREPAVIVESVGIAVPAFGMHDSILGIHVVKSLLPATAGRAIAETFSVKLPILISERR
jgi:hypothetical protein